jgi:excisionase family DNA binding protein
MKLLRIEEVAVALGRSFQAVRNAIAAGDLGAVRVGERGVRVREEDVAKYLERRTASRKALAGQQATGAEVIK